MTTHKPPPDAARPAGLRALAALALLAGLTACADAPQAPPLPLYRCEYGIEFTLRVVDNTAVLDSNRGYDVLLRDGARAGQYFSNPRMSAEFGLGATGREALLRYPLLPLAARCARD